MQPRPIAQPLLPQANKVAPSAAMTSNKVTVCQLLDDNYIFYTFGSWYNYYHFFSTFSLTLFGTRLKYKVCSCSNTESIRDNPYWIIKSCINKVSLV